MEGDCFCSHRPPDCCLDPRREAHCHSQGRFPPVRLLLGGLQEVLLVALRRVVLRQVVLRRGLHHGLRHRLHLGFRLGLYLVLLLGLFLGRRLLLHRRRQGLVDPVALWGFVQGVEKCQGGVLGDCPMYVGREFPQLIGLVGKKDPLGGPLGVPSSLGGRWGIGVGGVWNVNLSPSVGEGVVTSVVEGPATFVGSVIPCS